MNAMKLKKEDYEVIGKREVLKDSLQMIREKTFNLITPISDNRKGQILKEIKEMATSAEELLFELNDEKGNECE